MINTHILKQGDDEFERMRVFCTLRHFPELKTSLAHAPKLTIPRALSRDELKASKRIPRAEPSNSHKTLNKLCGSALNDVSDPYHNVKANMRVQRDRHRHTQMFFLFQEGRPFPQHPEHQTTINMSYEDTSRCSPLSSACNKLSQVGISFGPPGWIEQCTKDGTLEREVGGCGLLSVLGLPMYIRNTPVASPVAGSRPSSGVAGLTRQAADNSAAEQARLLSERLVIVLGVRLEPEETVALHAALYAHLR